MDTRPECENKSKTKKEKVKKGKAQNIKLKIGDYVMVKKGRFVGYYASVIGESYGDELEIQYFERCQGKYTLKEHDLDSREAGDLKKVSVSSVDVLGRFLFTQ